jgi:DNA-binding transcriptional MocR family regulator
VVEGDAVVIEDPTYIGAIDAFTLVRAQWRSLPVGTSGVDLETLQRLVSEAPPALVYLVPTFQNPTGTVLSESARREVAHLAEKSGTTVLEDESLVDLSFGTEPPPPIAAFGPQAPVLTVGSLSKLFWGGLRVGWVRGPRRLVAQLTRLKVTADLSGSAVSQALAARLLPHRDDVARRRRLESSARLEHLSTLLQERLPEGCHDHLRLPFVLDADVAAEGVTRLARAWAATTFWTRARRCCSTWPVRWPSAATPEWPSTLAWPPHRPGRHRDRRGVRQEDAANTEGNLESGSQTAAGV